MKGFKTKLAWAGRARIDFRNLDPFSEHSDFELETILDKAVHEVCKFPLCFWFPVRSGLASSCLWCLLVLGLLWTPLCWFA